jgi:HK97 family phage major capsid protein
MDINDLLTQKREAYDAANEIRERVYGEQGGEWRGDEEKKFEGLTATCDRLTTEIERMAKLDAIGKSFEEAEQGQGRRSDPAKPAPFGRPASRIIKPAAEARAIQAWMLGGTDQRTSEHAAAAQAFGLSLDQTQMKIRLAPVAPRSLRADDMREWEKRYLGVDTISPDLGGHLTTQINMLKPLEEALLAFGGIYSVATVDRTENGQALPYPLSNDTSNEGVLIGESVQDTAEAYPTIDQLVLDAFTYSSKKVFMSLEYVQDNAINAVGRIGGMLGERLARIRNRHLTTGDGNSKPRGVVTAAVSASVTTSAAGVVSYDNLIDLEHSVDPAYRGNARFMFNDAILKGLKKIKIPQFSGDTAGQPLWKAGMVTGDPDTINGYPFVINQHMLSTAGARGVVFGDLSKYQVREVRDITLVRLDELYAEYRQVVFLAWARWDGDLLDAGTNPVKFITMGS